MTAIADLTRKQFIATLRAAGESAGSGRTCVLCLHCGPDVQAKDGPGSAFRGVCGDHAACTARQALAVRHPTWEWDAPLDPAAAAAWRLSLTLWREARRAAGKRAG